MLSKGTEYLRYAIEMAYNGKTFHGWQIQPNALTVQQRINESLSLLLRRDINVVGAGRTDTGVHASHFVAHFDVDEPIMDREGFCYKLNSLVRDEIRINRIEMVPPDFHSRFDATARTYHYLINLEKNPFMKDFSWHFRTKLPIELMNQSASFLIGEQDFTSFARLHSETKTNLCSVSEAFWKEQGEFLIFKISADRFLRNMVRAIVGTLVEIGKQKLDPDFIKDLIEAKNRSLAGQSAPAQGLFLSKIDYPEHLFHVQPTSLFPALF